MIRLAEITEVIKYRLMHGCFHIGFHIRPDSSYLLDEGGQIWILIFARRRRANVSCLAEY
jgi:hypothetical protein